MAGELLDNGDIVLTQRELNGIFERVNKIEGWLNYEKAINKGLVEENKRLRKQVNSDLGVQILKITQEVTAIRMGRL